MQAEEVAVATAAVLGVSAPLPADSETVAGYDWDGPTDYEKLLGSYHRTGFQATNFGLAVDEINRMLKCRSTPLTEDTADIYEDDPFLKKKTNCTIFLGYTSNLVSSGLRDTIRFLVRERLVDCLVTTAGGVEEDIIKCLRPSYLGSWQLPGPALRARGLNRIGNILVPNDNYCAFERWLAPVLSEMHDQQDAGEVSWTPSKVASRLGERIQDENSILYWAYKNHIPVFSPALTDGSLGDMMFFHSYKRPGFILDILEDLRRINTIALKANYSGMIILGGGVVKHHICNANLMRNGADYSVYINTGLEVDGSDSGAPPDEAVSWGKIKPQAKPVKLFGDATVLFPLVVAQSFAKHHFCSNKKNV